MMSALRHHRYFPGTFEGAGTAATWLHEVAGAERLPDNLVFALEICLEELFTNVVRHGAPGRGPDGGPMPLSVDVAIELTGNHVDLVVSDNGMRFDTAHAEAHPVHGTLDETKPGGLGIQLIRSFSHDLRYELLPTGNRVIVKFLRQEAAEAKAGA
jgi:anti-sigma regulatory factor (Ser/Thr protein kinase)